MDYRFPSINNQNLFQEKDPPLFFDFPSPFLDDMDDHPTTTIVPNLHRDSTDTSKTTTTNNHLKLINTTTHKPSASRQIIKRIRKKRTAGKNDRHSKIHTAQGLRDRRMRLSVHTARKFFDLNDMLGFDKASKTIEWLFSKSQNAIKEVEETLQSDDANEIAADEDKGDQIKNVTKSKELFQEDPSVDFQLSQLGLFDTTTATITSANYNSIFDYNKTIAEPPVGWLNSRNTFLGFLEGWESQSSRLMESNKGFVANIASWSGTKRENASAGIVSSSFIKFQSGNEGQ